MSTDKAKTHDATLCVHPPAASMEGYASLAVPTYRASTIVYPDGEAFLRRAARGADGYTYGLHGTPTTRTLEEQLTRLHGGARTVIAPSGQAAVSLVMLAVLKPGDHVLIPDNAYPPVRALCAEYLEPRGIAHTVYDPMIGAGIAELFNERTRLLWIEAPGSGSMEVPDVPALIAAARARGVLTGCDNTWATALLFKPLAHGADFACEALTKYVGGHSDLLLGSIAVADIGLHRLLRATLGTLGIGVSPDDCALALRGIQTMAVRLAHAGKVAEDFARRLVGRPGVAAVLHPALPGHPGHAAYRRDFKGGSGLFSLVLEPGSEALLGAALSGLKVFAVGASWGGTHSLVAPQDIAAIRSASRWPHAGPLLRLSIGLEDPKSCGTTSSPCWSASALSEKCDFRLLQREERSPPSYRCEIAAAVGDPKALNEIPTLAQRAKAATVRDPCAGYGSCTCVHSSMSKPAGRTGQHVVWLWDVKYIPIGFRQ